MVANCNFEKTNCGLERITILYAVALILGLEDALSALFNALFNTSGVALARASELIAYFMIALVVVLRMFWAISNVHRYFEFRVKTDGTGRYLATRLVMLQFFLLLIQSTLILAMCEAFQLFAEGKRGPLLFFWFSIGTILFNGIWLCLLVADRPNKEPERTWSTNNLVCGGFAVFVLAGSMMLALPLYLTASTVAGLLVVNSLIDLLSTSRSYFDDRPLDTLA